MGDDVVLTRPGKPNLDDQFKAGANIRRTRRLYDRIKDANGKYKFGELTAFYNRYNEDQDDAWQDDILNNYSDAVIRQIRNHVVTVLEKVNPHNHNPSISLTFRWDPHGPARAELTQNGDAHVITIYASVEPANTSSDERQKTKSY